MTQTAADAPVRLTQTAHGGGCACKIPPDELERMVAGLPGFGRAGDGTGAGAGGYDHELLVGLDHGDDAAVVRLSGDTAIILTSDFFTPVVDSAYDWGRIAAANALSDVYAMGGTPLVAINLLGWPRDVLPLELATEVLRGGLDVARLAACHLAGGHSIDDPEPKYGLAVTGTASAAELFRIEAGTAGLPLSLTKPIGVGVLNNRHKVTGENFPQAVEVMTTLNRDAARAAATAGVRCATDVTGFGLLGHAYKLARASGVTIRIDPGAVPLLDGAADAVRAGYVSGGTRRNAAWVAQNVTWGAAVSEEMRILLADAQTSGGLLIAGEIPGAPVIGELVARAGTELVVG